MLAAVDEFEIRLKGKGGHAAMPHNTQDMVPAAAQLVLALQTLVSRETDPMKAAVVTVANIQAGTGAFNVIGETVTMGGTVRTFDPEVQDHIEGRMRAMGEGIAQAFGGSCELSYKRMLGPTINDAEATEYCQDAAARIVGESNVMLMPPIMGGEDFGAFLNVRPGAFMGVGQTEPEEPGSPHNSGLHTPQYDFNDRILPLAAEYFAELAERRLPVD
jgi:hippurate hydrolase